MPTKPALHNILKGIFHRENDEKQSQTQKVRKKWNSKRELTKPWELEKYQAWSTQ
jgi:hypothetical protein